MIPLAKRAAMIIESNRDIYVSTGE